MHTTHSQSGSMNPIRLMSVESMANSTDNQIIASNWRETMGRYDKCREALRLSLLLPVARENETRDTPNRKFVRRRG